MYSLNFFNDFTDNLDTVSWTKWTLSNRFCVLKLIFIHSVERSSKSDVEATTRDDNCLMIPTHVLLDIASNSFKFLSSVGKGFRLTNSGCIRNFANGILMIIIMMYLYASINVQNSFRWEDVMRWNSDVLLFFKAHIKIWCILMII